MRALRPILCALCLFGCDRRGVSSTSPVTADAPERRLMRLYDDNADHQLSAAELRPHLAGEGDFHALDADGNGTVSEPELRQSLWEQPTRLDH